MSSKNSLIEINGKTVAYRQGMRFVQFFTENKLSVEAEAQILFTAAKSAYAQQMVSTIQAHEWQGVRSTPVYDAKRGYFVDRIVATAKRTEASTDAEGIREAIQKKAEVSAKFESRALEHLAAFCQEKPKAKAA